MKGNISCNLQSNKCGNYSVCYRTRPEITSRCLMELITPSLTLWHTATFRDFLARTTGLHMALGARNCGAVSGREFFKGSKDTASLLVGT